MSQAPVLYQETRLSPAVAVPSQVLHITTTGEQQSSTFGAGRKRGFDEISGLDEESYARKHLAREGSVFFRRKERSPRSFLWRVLEDGKILEVQAVDLVQDTTIKGESWLTFRISLPQSIVHNGVACADPDDTDALEVFALTANGDIYTITLKRDLLMRSHAPSSFDAKTCFKKYGSSTLSFRHPYKFVAISNLELLVSLHDGGLLRLQRQAKDTGAQWRETLFTEGSWSGTLRGLIPLSRHQTVRYGNFELEPTAIVAIGESPDGKHIWTVSLDHELRAWSIQAGKKIASMDLLGNATEEERRKQKHLLAAEQGTLLQIMTVPASAEERRVTRMDEDERYYLVIHSPKDHQFKFYSVGAGAIPAEGGHLYLEDLAPTQRLVPPIDDLMNTNIWHLEEFHVHPGPNWEGTTIWMRARSGTVTQTFTITFDLLAGDRVSTNLQLHWQTAWVAANHGLQTIEATRSSIDYPGDLESFSTTPESPNEKWLKFLFKPGKFSTASLESALSIYRKGRGLATNSGGKGLKAVPSPLQERLTQAVSSKLIMRRRSNEQPDYERYQDDIHAQWKVYFSLLSHLHNRRNETVSLAYDAVEGLAWTVGADFVAPIRAGKKIERLLLNSHLVAEEKMQAVEDNTLSQIFPEPEQTLQSAFLEIAKGFFTSLSADFRQKFQAFVITKAFDYDEADSQDYKKRIQALYDGAGIASEVTDDDFDALEKAADVIGGLGSLTADFVVGVLENVCIFPKCTYRDHKDLTRYGAKFLVTNAMETLQSDHSVMLETLALVVFMIGEFEEDTLDPDLVTRTDEVYDAIIGRLRNNELLSWMARNEVPESPTQSRSNSGALQETEVPVVTLLERIAIGDWSPLSEGHETMPELLTLWGKQWTYASDLFNNWNGITAHVLGTLLKERQYELATDFQRFIAPEESSSGWIRYLQGRLHLVTGDYALASVKFRAAGTDMGELQNVATEDSAFLLSAEERNYFGVGQTAFYQHVVVLFERLKVWSYTAEFARLGLDCLENSIDAAKIYQQDQRRFDPDSSQMEIIDAVMEQQKLLKGAGNVREELLGRLFNALLQSGRFKEAFDALKQLDDLPVKRSELKKLLKACVKEDAVRDLLDLPFEDANLVQEADAVLLSLAKKQLASSSSSGSLPFYQILYAFRTQRSNFRGAAELLYEHLERLRHAHKKHGMQDPEDETLIHAYVLLINTLACCGEDDAWLLADSIDDVHGPNAKRRLVKLGDVRREYAAELDRRSDILQGRFPFVADGDEMDAL